MPMPAGRSSSGTRMTSTRAISSWLTRRGAGGEGDQDGKLDGPADAPREVPRIDNHRGAPGDRRGDLEVVAQSVEEQALAEALQEGVVAAVGEVLADRREPEPPVVMTEGEGLGNGGDGPVPERRVGHDRLVERRQRHEPAVGGRSDGDIDRRMQRDVGREGGRREDIAKQQQGRRPRQP